MLEPLPIYVIELHSGTLLLNHVIWDDIGPNSVTVYGITHEKKSYIITIVIGTAFSKIVYMDTQTGM